MSQRGIKIKKCGISITLTSDEVEQIVREWYIGGLEPCEFVNDTREEIDEYLVDASESLKAKTIKIKGTIS